MKLAVTIDTEADGQWEPGVPLTTRNVAFWEPFQELCETHGVPPTYLVATEIIEDGRARDLLSGWAQRGAAEVGAHLHPWTTPPFADRPGLRFNDPAHAFPSQLPDDLLREKTAVLTEHITAAFGTRPTSYRAGRFGSTSAVRSTWPTRATSSTRRSRLSGPGAVTPVLAATAGRTFAGTRRERSVSMAPAAPAFSRSRSPCSRPTPPCGARVRCWRPTVHYPFAPSAESCSRAGSCLSPCGSRPTRAIAQQILQGSGVAPRTPGSNRR